MTTIAAIITIVAASASLLPLPPPSHIIIIVIFIFFKISIAVKPIDPKLSVSNQKHLLSFIVAVGH